MIENNADRAYASLLNHIAMSGNEKSRESSSANSVAKGSKSWLAALVEGLNKMITESWKDMTAASNAVTKDDPATMTNFQVKSQEFSLLMNTAQTVVKTIGEANTKAASKQ
ncbi:EscF/YscF/HrpA family type III secretion system needle major subunit [Luteimonas panaciterrae]|uniref:EscF/YscF/HrpA family type III secretion system needle major subunit n=1 Tax=Luteimonas panaciterrae TaxID=363885 RepID=UPI001CF9502C|nr:EscF/YscF/HrpA family type III secretion system needle major subunit [Luteimonas panaciterrae]